MPGQFNMSQQNFHSIYLNSVAKNVTGQGGPVYPDASFTSWISIARLDEHELAWHLSGLDRAPAGPGRLTVEALRESQVALTYRLEVKQ